MRNKFEVFDFFFSFLRSSRFESFSRWSLKPSDRWVLEYSLTTLKIPICERSFFNNWCFDHDKDASDLLPDTRLHDKLIKIQYSGTPCIFLPSYYEIIRNCSTWLSSTTIIYSTLTPHEHLFSCERPKLFRIGDILTLAMFLSQCQYDVELRDILLLSIVSHIFLDKIKHRCWPYFKIILFSWQNNALKKVVTDWLYM